MSLIKQTMASRYLGNAMAAYFVASSIRGAYFGAITGDPTVVAMDAIDAPMTLERLWTPPELMTTMHPTLVHRITAAGFGLATGFAMAPVTPIVALMSLRSNT